MQLKPDLLSWRMQVLSDSERSLWTQQVSAARPTCCLSKVFRRCNRKQLVRQGDDLHFQLTRDTYNTRWYGRMHYG